MSRRNPTTYKPSNKGRRIKSDTKFSTGSLEKSRAAQEESSRIQQEFMVRMAIKQFLGNEGRIAAAMTAILLGQTLVDFTLEQEADAREKLKIIGKMIKGEEVPVAWQKKTFTEAFVEFCIGNSRFEKMFIGSEYKSIIESRGATSLVHDAAHVVRERARHAETFAKGSKKPTSPPKAPAAASEAKYVVPPAVDKAPSKWFPEMPSLASITSGAAVGAALSTVTGPVIGAITAVLASQISRVKGSSEGKSSQSLPPVLTDVYSATKEYDKPQHPNLFLPEKKIFAEGRDYAVFLDGRVIPLEDAIVAMDLAKTKSSDLYFFPLKKEHLRNIEEIAIARSSLQGLISRLENEIRSDIEKAFNATLENYKTTPAKNIDEVYLFYAKKVSSFMATKFGLNQADILDDITALVKSSYVEQKFDGEVLFNSLTQVLIPSLLEKGISYGRDRVSVEAEVRAQEIIKEFSEYQKDGAANEVFRGFSDRTAKLEKFIKNPLATFILRNPNTAEIENATKLSPYSENVFIVTGKPKSLGDCVTWASLRSADLKNYRDLLDGHVRQATNIDYAEIARGLNSRDTKVNRYKLSAEKILDHLPHPSEEIDLGGVANIIPTATYLLSPQEFLVLMPNLAVIRSKTIDQDCAEAKLYAAILKGDFFRVREIIEKNPDILTKEYDGILLGKLPHILVENEYDRRVATKSAYSYKEISELVGLPTAEAEIVSESSELARSATILADGLAAGAVGGTVAAAAAMAAVGLTEVVAKTDSTPSATSVDLIFKDSPRYLADELTMPEDRVFVEGLDYALFVDGTIIPLEDALKIMYDSEDMRVFFTPLKKADLENSRKVADAGKQLLDNIRKYENYFKNKLYDISKESPASDNPPLAASSSIAKMLTEVLNFKTTTDQTQRIVHDSIVVDRTIGRATIDVNKMLENLMEYINTVAKKKSATTTLRTEEESRIGKLKLNFRDYERKAILRSLAENTFDDRVNKLQRYVSNENASIILKSKDSHGDIAHDIIFDRDAVIFAVSHDLIGTNALTHEPIHHHDKVICRTDREGNIYNFGALFYEPCGTDHDIDAMLSKKLDKALLADEMTLKRELGSSHEIFLRLAHYKSITSAVKLPFSHEVIPTITDYLSPLRLLEMAPNVAVVRASTIIQDYDEARLYAAILKCDLPRVTEMLDRDPSILNQKYDKIPLHELPAILVANNYDHRLISEIKPATSFEEVAKFIQEKHKLNLPVAHRRDVTNLIRESLDGKGGTQTSSGRIDL